MSRIYVATSFKNIPEAREVMDALRADGHTISHDWTNERVDPSWPAERQAHYLQHCGSQDYDGVRSADALVLINHAESRDAMAEFGIALGMQIPVYVLFPERRGSVFFHRTLTADSLPRLLRLLRSFH